MQHRRSLRLLAGALVLALPLLSACGFNKATDKVYTPAAGIDARDGVVDVLSAVVVAAQDDSGTFVASLSNNSTTKDYTLTGVAGAGDWTDLTVSPDALSIKVVKRGFVNLVDQDPITVTGDFQAGQVVTLTLTFDSGDAVTTDVPVVFACNAYEGLDPSVSGASASPSASPSDSASPGQVPSESSSPSASASGAPSPGAPYDCTSVLEESSAP